MCCIRYLHHIDKYLYLSPLLWSKTTLIASYVGWKGIPPTFLKNEDNFCYVLGSYLVRTFYQKILRTRDVGTFKLWSKGLSTYHIRLIGRGTGCLLSQGAMQCNNLTRPFESFHSSCPMRYFVEYWHTKAKGKRKNALILYVGGSAP